MRPRCRSERRAVVREATARFWRFALLIAFLVAPGGSLLAQEFQYKLGPGDQPALDEIAERTAADGYKMQTLLRQVILSEPFLSKTNPKSARATTER